MSTPEPRLCGRDTKGHTPCRQPVHNRFHPACARHMTEQERAVAAAAEAAYRQGFQDGYRAMAESSIAQDEYERARLRRRIAELEDAKRRMRDRDGAQIVAIGRYAYRWTGSPDLAIGDLVELPDTGLGHWRGKVTELGTLWTGPLATVHRVLERVGVDA